MRQIGRNLGGSGQGTFPSNCTEHTFRSGLEYFRTLYQLMRLYSVGWSTAGKLWTGRDSAEIGHGVCYVLSQHVPEGTEKTQESKTAHIPEVTELPTARGWSWATLSPGVTNTETWSSRLGEANELELPDSGGSTRRPAPGPLSGAGSTPLPAQEKGSSARSSAQGPVVLPTPSTGEQAAFSGRQLSYAEVGAA
jgi:hypothetical protein